MSTSPSSQSDSAIPGSVLAWKRDPVSISDWILYDTSVANYHELARVTPSLHRTRYRWIVYGKPDCFGSTPSLELSQEEAAKLVLERYSDKHLPAKPSMLM